MKYLLLISLLCLAATLPPIPKVKRNHKSAAVMQGAGAAKLIARISPSVSRTNTFTWQYAVNPSNYWWDIQQAASPSGPWTTLVTNASGPYSVNVNKAQPLMIYRLKGRLSP